MSTTPACEREDVPGRDALCERVTRGGGRDRRMASPTAVKAGVGVPGTGQQVWRWFRDLVLDGRDTWRTAEQGHRQRVARRIGRTLGTLDRLMSPSDCLQPKAEELFAMLAAEDLVGEGTRARIVAEIAKELGGVLVPESDVQAAEARAATAALHLAADAGRAAELIASATAPGKPGCVPDGHGGCRIDAHEREQIAMAAGRAQREAAGLALLMREGGEKDTRASGAGSGAGRKGVKR